MQNSISNDGSACSLKLEGKREASLRRKDIKSGGKTNAEEDEISEESNEDSETEDNDDIEAQEKGYYGRSDLSSGED